jgi:hypothetical protein
MQVGPDTYFIAVTANGYTSLTTAQMYLQRRAMELCPQGFDLAGATADNTSSGAFVHRKAQTGFTTVTTIQKPQVSATVQCRRPTTADVGGVARTTPQPNARLVPVVDVTQAAVYPNSTTEAATPDARMALARHFDDRMRDAVPPMRVNADGEETRTLLITSTLCGQGEGFLTGPHASAGIRGPTSQPRLHARGVPRGSRPGILDAVAACIVEPTVA